MIRSPRIDSDFFRLRNPPPPVAPQNVEWCCIWDSVQSVEQPWAHPRASAGRGQFPIRQDHIVIASGAKQPMGRATRPLGCFVASLLAMTIRLYGTPA